MRAAGLVLSVLLALGAGYFVVPKSVSSSPVQGSPQEQIDVVAIRQRLLTLGQAERQYLATHGTYATLEQLRQEDLLVDGAAQRGYAVRVVATGSTGFTITATPTDANKTGWPTLEITESMQVTER
jgi:hypothetical protein